MQLLNQLCGWCCLLLLLVVTSCDRNEIDVAANTNFPPAILSSTPSADGRVVAGDFDVRVLFADGSTSPLRSATVTLLDSNLTEITSLTQELSGTQDSLVIEGSSFGADQLGVGTYNMTISVTDTEGQLTEQSFSFEISNLPFPANYEAIHLAGAFNGWDPKANELTLVGANMWEIQGVDLQGGAWKLVDGPSFGGVDFGDADCNGFMESNQSAGGNGDTDCGFSGLANIRFNDQTLSYSVTAQVTFASNTMALYLLGTFNDFQGDEYQFTLTDDNSWSLDEVLLEPGDQFKFAEMPDFQGVNYGDTDMDGVAQQGGSNIVLADTAAAGFYSISFNDASLAYELTFLRAALPENIGVLGTAVGGTGGFEVEDTDLTNEGDGIFTLTLDLMEGELKFRADDDWALNYGGNGFPEGDLIVGGDNIQVPTAATYRITLDLNNLTYSFTEDAGIQSIGIIGTATPNGWDSDTDLIALEDGTYARILELTDGEAKFRANDDWDLSWGATDFPSGTGITEDGPNIPVTAGLYLVTFDPASGAYTFTPATVGIIGNATPGGWDSDTDLSTTDVVGELSATLELVEGEVKFRANDEWTYDWGGADFPSGTAVFKGDNIAVTAGTYTVIFDVNALTYRFEQ